MLNYAVQLRFIRVKLVKANLIPGIQKNKHAYGEANAKAGDLDDGKNFISGEIPPCDREIVFVHDISLVARYKCHDPLDKERAILQIIKNHFIDFRRVLLVYDFDTLTVPIRKSFSLKIFKCRRAKEPTR